MGDYKLNYNLIITKKNYQVSTSSMNKTFEKYAYNFNPRDGPKDIKLRYLMKIGVLKRFSIPIGKYT